ncbi:MAG: hypothetical protein A2X25_12940 [Chloroflexi bacterium GWB2_49_20]|nr:MAG: hypothetical protein A2X25_12940 [Chloroflexi bacterium GWB2_49_20]OGN78376.1 MAG: hypothetical protein A2X26_01260 [Chloroflexi bacterium GWC2_49_37]OGN84160.1 MAG: hypothetical protein A2X27_14430 [Chloroflexi bacterium GWD2_49_16]HBG75188.1 hypothetical protein [Anaerolineae bacterium]HCC79177.1 hypothetical protein [Anaerolineae bacterium]
MTQADEKIAFENWGFYINPSEYSQSFPSIPDWANPSQVQDWKMRGLIIWDSNIKIVTHLFAVYAIKIMMKMKAEGNWKTEGIVIGTPAYEFSIQLKRKKRKKNEEEEPEEKPNGKWILANQIPLSPLQAEEFLNFLARNEDSLQRVALAEEEDRKRRLSQVYEILFRDGMDEIVETPTPPKVSPVSIPEGDYLTVAQIAEYCKVTVRKINNWIEKEQIAFLELPLTGRLLHLKDVNILLAKKGVSEINFGEEKETKDI